MSGQRCAFTPIQVNALFTHRVTKIACADKCFVCFSRKYILFFFARLWLFSCANLTLSLSFSLRICSIIFITITIIIITATRIHGIAPDCVPYSGNTNLTIKGVGFMSTTADKHTHTQSLSVTVKFTSPAIDKKKLIGTVKGQYNWNTNCITCTVMDLSKHARLSTQLLLRCDSLAILPLPVIC